LAQSVRELRDLIEMFKLSGIEELELDRDGFRIRLKRSGTLPAAGPAPAFGFPSAAPSGLSEPAFTMPSAESRAAAEDAEEGKFVKVVAPMVGTFYRAPAPDAPPYVQAGDTVKEGQVLGIIEAMKLMNEIKAETAGKIAKIKYENGQPVEFGQPLFLVEPLR
jgi:acetyl-CoA carboxylase biotin carboxyl carrier protein